MPSLPRQQIILIAVVLAATTAALFAIYLLFFRTPMVPAYQNIRQSDASAIVAELDKAGIPYRLENDGHDVLVPEDRTSEARVAVAGSNLPLGGTVGFELFDNSDMGLTEFAQKINFQRAMQGELSRTIMAMRGVEYARVHLALPERSIFRSSQGEPTAAVTIQMMRGQPLTIQRIEGIQQLVASSIPGLSQTAVSILDDKGDLVSAAPPVSGGVGAPLDERSALAQYYEAIASEVLRDMLSDTRFTVTVNPKQMPGLDSLDTGGIARGEPERADVILDVTVRTADPLEAGVQSRAEAAIADRLSLDSAKGDLLKFTVGPLGSGYRLPTPVPSPTIAVTDDVAKSSAASGWSVGGDGRIWALLFLFVAILALTLRPRRRLDDAQAGSFADQLKAMAAERGTAHVD